MLDPAIDGAVRAEVLKVLSLIRDTIAGIAEQPRPEPAGLPGLDGGRRPVLRLVSPLAEGSDRLAAEIALMAGYTLYSPLPFPRPEYEKDFPASADEFERLLSQSTVLELDGTRELATDAYREVGRFVVRNCDLLIAVWDGSTERGAGGTAEIVRFAANLKVPIWWIRLSGSAPPSFVQSSHALQTARLGTSSGSADAELVDYITRLVTPPRVGEVEHVGTFGRAAHLLVRAAGKDVSPLCDFLSETDLKKRSIWQTYSNTINSLISRAVNNQRPSAAPQGASSDPSWWLQYFKPADRLSEGYGDRYRSSYVLIAIFAFVAVATPAVGNVLPDRFEVLAGLVEAIALANIAGLVTASYFYRWHERWISYRLLAELLRKQAILWTIGRSLPLEEILQAVSDDEGAAKLPREAWIAWYFATVVRSAPPLTGNLAAQRREAVASAEALIEDQIRYHRWRAASSKAAASAIEKIGELFFFFTATVGFLKMGLLFSGHAGSPVEWLTAFGACLSALSASFVGIRTYSELPLLVQQSLRMIKVLKSSALELTAIDLDEPASSVRIGHVMNVLTLSMMQDVTGWMQLFRIKSVEAA
jgi:hypothetical protein